MKSILLLSCLVFIVGSLVWTSNAQIDFESEKERAILVYKSAYPSSVLDDNILFLLNFLVHYANEIQLTPEQKSKFADLVRQHREFTRRLRVLIDREIPILASEVVKEAKEICCPNKL